jgi:AmiR/NasT family two-component response regulator
MIGPRVVQNFAGGVGHLVTADGRVKEAMEGTLRKLGVSLECPPFVDGKAVIDFASLRDERDVLFVDSDLNHPINTPDGSPLLPAAVPVIGIIGVESPSRLRFLIQFGATSLLRKPIHTATVYSALFIGINVFFRQRNLEASLEAQERRHRGRRVVVKAIVSLMSRAGINDDQAYAILRRESMRRQLKIEDYCAMAVGSNSDNAKSATVDESDRATGLK